MRDHEKRELINAVTEAARTYAGTQQLRERIAAILLPVLDAHPFTVRVDVRVDTHPSVEVGIA